MYLRNPVERSDLLLDQIQLLASGKITDPAEARFLKQRLEELEARSAARR